MIKSREEISCQEVILQQGKGSPHKGGKVGEYYWHIYIGSVRAGSVYINYIRDNLIGSHASIHLFINKALRGRHIGRCAYQMACEASHYETIYAHMRKSNLASKKAALEAGFVLHQGNSGLQLTLAWHRVKK